MRLTPALRRGIALARREAPREAPQRLIALVALAFALHALTTVGPVPLEAQPFPDSAVYADTAYQIANGNGFLTRVRDSRRADQHRDSGTLRPGRYAPGFSLALAPFVRFGDNEITDTQTGARVVAMALLVALFVAAWCLGGPIAAAIAAIVSMSSPFVERSSRLVLADGFGALLTLLILIAVAMASSSHAGERARQGWYYAAGLLAGYGVLTRVNFVLTLAAVLAIAGRWRHVRAVALGALPCLVFLAAYQWTQFGHPLRTGYDYYLPNLVPFEVGNVTKERLFGERGFIFDDRLHGALMRWTCPCDEFGPLGQASNLVFYPAVLLGLYWIYYPPLFSLLGLWEMVRRRRVAVARLGALIVVSNALVYLGYFYQAGRFVAPASLVLLAFSSAALADLLIVAGQRVVGPWRVAGSPAMGGTTKRPCSATTAR